MGKINSRDKGKRGELELAALIRAHGFDSRRGCQFKGAEDSPDVTISEVPIHIECKRVERLDLYGALAQARKDAGGKIPTVWHRRNGEEWVVILPAEAFLVGLERLFPPGGTPGEEDGE